MAARSPFAWRKIAPERLTTKGFIQTEKGWLYTQPTQEGSLHLSVLLCPDGKGKAQIHTPAQETGESTNELTLEFCWKGAHAEHSLAWPCQLPWFARLVKPEMEELLADIAEQCFIPDVFRAPQTLNLITYVQQHHGDELEYLWKRFPKNAVWRRADTRKWYAAVLTISRRKLGQDSDERVEILDFRIPPAEREALVDNERIFPGYHMNKLHWCTLILDGSVPLNTITSLLEKSYQLAR